ncbi:Surface antigen [Anaplasma phagocytophilum]|nr:Surface antigen [Anaplasma phagocytophilum]
MLVAMEGSVGYGIGGARVELEIGCERFRTKGMRDRGSKEDEADTVYLLAKALAYDVVTGQTDNLAAALAKTSGKDIVQFAKAVEISHSDIGKKVCKTKPNSGTNNYGKYAPETDTTAEKSDVAICGGKGGTSEGGSSEEVFKQFIEKTLKDGSQNWPTSKDKGPGARSEVKSKQNDNAKAVAKDLVDLNRDEKTIVAGLLAKTIEGGEVVEIRAVSSTSLRT